MYCFICYSVFGILHLSLHTHACIVTAETLSMIVNVVSHHTPMRVSLLAVFLRSYSHHISMHVLLLPLFFLIRLSTSLTTHPCMYCYSNNAQSHAHFHMQFCSIHTSGMFSRAITTLFFLANQKELPFSLDYFGAKPSLFYERFRFALRRG